MVDRRRILQIAGDAGADIMVIKKVFQRIPWNDGYRSSVVSRELAKEMDEGPERTLKRDQQFPPFESLRIMWF